VRAAPILRSGDEPSGRLNRSFLRFDVGAVAFIHQQLLDACAHGAAVLLVSDDLDEIFVLADRIAVMHAGRLTAARPAAEWSLSAIGLAMASASPLEASRAG